MYISPPMYSDTQPIYDNRQQGAPKQKVLHSGHLKQCRKLREHVHHPHLGSNPGRRPSPVDVSVEELVRTCSLLPPDASTVAAVSSSLVHLDSRAVAALMKDLAKSQQPMRAMELFDWLQALPIGHELYNLCDVYTFTTAISLMGPPQQLRRALQLVGEMRARGLQCNVHTYSALMNVCVKCNACDLALDVFKQMHDDNIRPNVVTYNTLVDVYGKTGQWDKAIRVLDDMRQEDLEPEVRTFNTAIIACNMCGQPKEALKVYQQLLTAGLQPSGTTYTALISVFGKAGQLEKAMETFNTMVQQGLERSVITYSALMSACEKAGRWELAFELFVQMRRDGCKPNTVTYNSLIMACQQGGQADKASEVFEQMQSTGCRPDAVTYSTLIGTYSKTGQWRKVAAMFEQVQQQHCKLDSYVYQMVIDSLWCTGVGWAQAKALQLFNTASRIWQHRLTVQQDVSSSSIDLEYVLPASTPGVTVLSMRRWLLDMSGQAESSKTLFGASHRRIILSLGCCKHAKDQHADSTCQAIIEVLAGLRSPFMPGSRCATSHGTVVVAEADLHAVMVWLQAPVLPSLLALMAPYSPVNSRQYNPGASHPKRFSFAAELSQDTQLEDSCGRAYRTVLGVELTQLVQVDSMAKEYILERQGLISTAFQMAQQLQLADEVVFDAVLIMDRVMSTGTAHNTNLGSLVVAAALQLAALQTVSGSATHALSNALSDAVLSAAVNFPSGSVTKMQENIRLALGGDTTSISIKRTLNLFLERMGADQQQCSHSAAQFNKGLSALLRSVLMDAATLRWRPAVLATAVLVAARQAVGCHPALPGCVQQLTSMAMDDPKLAAAVAAVQPLAASAGLEPQADASPTVCFDGSLFSPEPLLSLTAPMYTSSCSGYSSPSYTATPTAAATMGDYVHFELPSKSLLESFMQQHIPLHRNNSDLSIVSGQTCSDPGSTADRLALQRPTTFSSTTAPSSQCHNAPTQPVSQAYLATALAELHLSSLQHGNPAALQSRWSEAEGSSSCLGGNQPQTRFSSRLQHMTSPFIAPTSIQHQFPPCDQL